MVDLTSLIARHPVNEEPYNLLRFSRRDGMGTLLYRFANEPKEMGAETALRHAAMTKGGRCFHCRHRLSLKALEWTIDHMRPRALEGSSRLYTLVLSCVHCNRRKSDRAIEEFDPRRCSEYLRALERHIERYLSES